jgi:hypothetical protein
MTIWFKYATPRRYLLINRPDHPLARSAGTYCFTADSAEALGPTGEPNQNPSGL